MRKENISLKTNFERINGQVNFLLSFLGIQENQSVGVDREVAVQTCSDFQVDDNDLCVTVDTNNSRSEHAQSLVSTVVQKKGPNLQQAADHPQRAKRGEAKI